MLVSFSNIFNQDLKQKLSISKLKPWRSHAFRAFKTIKRALDGLAEQTLLPRRIIVVDGGSDYGTYHGAASTGINSNQSFYNNRIEVLAKREIKRLKSQGVNIWRFWMPTNNGYLKRSREVCSTFKLGIWFWLPILDANNHN